jgi:hypothetical protein
MPDWRVACHNLMAISVVEHVGGAAARAHIDSLAQLYTGADYANPVQTERVIVKIKPDTSSRSRRANGRPSVLHDDE